MTEHETCPKCGARLPANAPAGLCPKCLMAAGLEQSASADTPKSDPEAPTVESPSPGRGFLPPSAAELADKFPQLEILELLGHGGMGAVYKARQTNLDRLVALKIIRPETTHDPAFAERFNREARTLARLSHQQIVSVYDFGEVEYSEADDQPARPLYYFLMEYVDGVNLRQLIRSGELTPEQALTIVPQICDALQYAHDEGVVHRDIKPENILLDKRGRVKIADFGLAKLATRSEAEFTLTGTHQVMGTLRYMAPEQLEGSHSVDHRADINSLGVVFYEMLTGEAPIGHFDPPSKKVEVDVRLDEVVLRSLAREPERRYQQASDIRTDVEAISIAPCLATNKVEHALSDAAVQSATAHSELRNQGEELPSHGGRDWVTLTREQIDNDRLPDCCIVCGRHTVERVNKDFEYQPEWASLLSIIGLFCGFFPGLIVIWLTTQKMRMACPICPTHREARRRLVWFASTAWIAAPLLGLVGFGLVYPFFEVKSPAVIIGPLLGAIVGLIVYLVPVLRLVRYTIGVEWMTSDYVRLRRVSAEFARQAALLAGIDQSDSALGSEALPSPNTIRTAWDAWWSERNNWFTNAVLALLLAAHLAGMAAVFYRSGYSESTPASRIGGETRTGSISASVQLGWPSPWYRFDRESNESGFSSRPQFRLFASSALLGALGIFAYYAFWRIRKVQSRGGPIQRWLTPQVVAGFWAILAILAILICRHVTDKNFDKMAKFASATKEGHKPQGSEELTDPAADIKPADPSNDDNQPISRDDRPEPPSSNEPASTPLLDAVRRGEVSEVKRLLDEGASVNDKDAAGRTPLMQAAESGHASLAATLVLLGANVNERDDFGKTALMYAAENGRNSVLESLQSVESAANIFPPNERREQAFRELPGVDHRLLPGGTPIIGRFKIAMHAQDNSGETAQMKAAAHGNVDWFRKLWPYIDATDDNRQDNNGRTTMMHAIENNQMTLMSYFASSHNHKSWDSPFAGPNSLLKDNQGRTALDLAKELGRDAMVELIREEAAAVVRGFTSWIESADESDRPAMYRQRAIAWRVLGEGEKADADLRRAEELDASKAESSKDDESEGEADS